MIPSRRTQPTSTAGGTTPTLRRISLYLTETVLGFIFYWLLPRKKIVYILSPQRCGSTLVKALLGMAPDVSHIPEFDFTRFSLNRYRWYLRIFRLSSRPILVLKHPAPPGNPSRWTLLPSLPCKIIILYRPASAVVSSIERMPPHTRHPSLDSRRRIAEYWCDVYEMLLGHYGSRENVRIVAYDELVSRPKETTGEILRWMESRQSEGFDTYVQSGAVTWEWGTDDGGSKIRQLKVIPDGSRSVPPLDSLGTTSERVRRVQDRLEGSRFRKGVA